MTRYWHPVFQTALQRATKDLPFEIPDQHAASGNLRMSNVCPDDGHFFIISYRYKQ